LREEGEGDGEFGRRQRPKKKHKGGARKSVLTRSGKGLLRIVNTIVEIVKERSDWTRFKDPEDR